LSGNNRHGTLINFAYEGVSGYQENGTGGILLDDVDDKIVRPAIPNIQYTSASRNLFDKTTIIMGKYHSSAGILVNEATSSASEFFVEVESTKTYTWGDIDRYKIIVMTFDENKLPLERFTTYTILSRQFNSNVKYVQFSSYQTNYTFSDFQVEEGSVPTPYTPYIPLPIMTYQMNGNILSFEKDGTVKRTTKDANGDEVVVSRKGINLVRNGNEVKYKKITSSYYTSAPYNATLSTSDLIYISAEAKTDDNDVRSLHMQMTDGYGNRGWGQKAYPERGVWYKLEDIMTPRPESVLPYIGVLTPYIVGDSGNPTSTLGKAIEARNAYAYNLTEAYGAGNEPTLEYIKAHPEEFAWTPNPNDLIETVEIKNNLVGDLENLQGNDFGQHEDGVITYTNEAEEGSVVRVDIDGISDQPLRFRTSEGEQVVITEHDQVDADAIKKIEFQGNSVQLADKYREVNGTSVTIAPELHDKSVADKLVIGGNTTQYTESSNVVTDGLEMWLSGRNFSNSPATTVWKDLTGVNNGTVSGFAYTNISGSNSNGGIAFDAVDDNIDIPHSNEYKKAERITIECIASINNSAAATHQMIFSGANGTYLSFFSYKPFVSFWINGAQHTVDSGIVANKNQNYHIVATYNGSVMKIFVDGVFKASKAVVGVLDIGTISKKIGRYYDSNFRLNGSIHSMRIYSRALTDAEILQNYNAGLAIPIPNIAMPQEVKHVNSGSLIVTKKGNMLEGIPIVRFGDISLATGLQTSGMRTVLTDFVTVTPLAQYMLVRPVDSGNVGTRYYDSYKNFIGTVNLGKKYNYIFSVPENCHYFKFIDEANASVDGYSMHDSFQETTIPVTLKSIG